MAVTSPSCPSPVCFSYYLCLKKLNIKGEYKIYPVRDPLLVPLGVKTVNFLSGGTLHHRSRRMHISIQCSVRCTYQSSILEGCTYISLVLPNDEPISLVFPNDAQQVVIPRTPARYTTPQIKLKKIPNSIHIVHNNHIKTQLKTIGISPFRHFSFSTHGLSK